MPTRAPTLCAGGCGRTVPRGHCDTCRPLVHQGKDAARGTAAQRGYGWRWQKARTAWLRHHPLCVRCELKGITEPATVVDHITPHQGDPRVFWDKSNWQGLCATCHNAKTAGEVNTRRAQRAAGRSSTP